MLHTRGPAGVRGGGNVTQFLRYATVGVLSNAGGYLLYLAITWVGISPKAAMTGLYLTTATIGFFGNRQWAFSSRAGVPGSLLRYGMAHALGYSLNLALLTVFVDHLGYSHRWVQAMAIGVVAIFLFFTFRFFVFPSRLNPIRAAR